MKLNASLAPVFVAGMLAGAALGAGCGGEWSPSGIGPTVGPESVASSVPGLGDDMVTPPETDEVAETRAALSGTGGTDGTSEKEPRVIYLFYADGNPLPKTNVNACHGTPPKFRCNFGSSLLDCQRQIQSYLDRVVRRLQRHLHVHPADQRQVLHRGGRARAAAPGAASRPRLPASRRFCARTWMAASRTRSTAAKRAARPR